MALDVKNAPLFKAWLVKRLEALAASYVLPVLREDCALMRANRVAY